MTRAATRHLIAWWLGRALSPAALAGALGDLDEEFITRVRTTGRWRAELWMLREAHSIARAYRRERGTDARPALALVRDLGAGLVESLRHLRRAPGYTVMAAGSLGLAVAAITSTAGASIFTPASPAIVSARCERLIRSTSACVRKMRASGVPRFSP